ncbi:MAG: sugar phosphate isomerase/epimerase, partial [Victivallales bacterium]|nr:sugar phosphate isomerase/epimerase [Victivallales bacterium]
EVAEFARSFNSPNISVCIDLNHSNLNEDLTQVSENCKGLISNIHVSDNHGEWEDHLPPGEGIINFPEVFKALRDNGYVGPCNIECHVPDEITTQLLRDIYRNTSQLM